jgi:Fic family protein
MTTTDLLGKIMGTPARVKLMRLFLFHPGTGFTRDELMTKTKTQATTLRTELSLLEKIGFITKKDVTRSIAKVTKKKTTTVKKRVTVYLFSLI